MTFWNPKGESLAQRFEFYFCMTSGAGEMLNLTQTTKVELTSAISPGAEVKVERRATAFRKLGMQAVFQRPWRCSASGKN